MRPFLEGLIAGYGIAIPVGAVAVLIVNTAIRCGFRTGFMAGAGAASADFLYAVLASVAGVALTAALKPIAIPLQVLGGVVLVVIAARGLWHGQERSADPERATGDCASPRIYIQFLGITILNPLTIVYFTAFIIGRDLSTADYTLQASLLFVAGAGLSSLSWQSLLAAIGGIAGRRLAPRMQFGAIILGNLLVMVMGLRILLSVLLS